MRSKFAGYYPPSDIELSTMWGSGLVALDANALLNLYRYTDGTKNEFLAALHSLEGRLWIPFQAALEFHRRRLDVIGQQSTAFETIGAALAEARKTIASKTDEYRRHPVLDMAVFLEDYDAAVRPLLERLDSLKARHAEGAPKSPHDDSILLAITAIFDDRVGNGFEEAELRSIYEEGAERYTKDIPPGYKDKHKPEPDRYGDLVIWKELLRKGADSKTPLIFVTDDRKEDWWYLSHGMTVGPRVELVDEYLAAAGMRVHFYTPQQFLRYAKDHLNASVSAKSIGEVEAVSIQQTHIHAQAILAARRAALGDLVAQLESDMSEVDDRFRADSNAFMSEPELQSEIALRRSEIGSLHSELQALGRRTLLAREEYEQGSGQGGREAALSELSEIRKVEMDARRRKDEVERELGALMRERNRHSYLHRRHPSEAEVVEARLRAAVEELAEVDSALAELGYADRGRERS